MTVLTVGLTGGIASGKSTVGRWLEELGCLVSDADRLVAELYQPGAAGTAAVREIFSKDVLDPRGAVDKPKLAELVFNDQPALRKLEAAIHPLVGQAYAALVEDADGIVVFEAPLLVETGGAERYDVLVTVEADAKRRLERAIARGVDAESARARIRQQTDSASRMARADFVLHNDGTLDELRAQVEELVAELERRLAAS